MITSIQTCRFQRSKDVEVTPKYPIGKKCIPKWEEGLLLNEGDLGIIDSKGNRVESVWDYKTTIFIALFELKIGT